MSILSKIQEPIPQSIKIDLKSKTPQVGPQEGGIKKISVEVARLEYLYLDLDQDLHQETNHYTRPHVDFGNVYAQINGGGKGMYGREMSNIKGTRKIWTIFDKDHPPIKKNPAGFEKGKQVFAENLKTEGARYLVQKPGLVVLLPLGQVHSVLTFTDKPLIVTGGQFLRSADEARMSVIHIHSYLIDQDNKQWVDRVQEGRSRFAEIYGFETQRIPV